MGINSPEIAWGVAETQSHKEGMLVAQNKVSPVLKKQRCSRESSLIAFK